MGNNNKTIFEILDLDLDTSEDIIKKSYLKYLYQCHPNKGGNANDFIELSEAYNEYLQGNDCSNYLETLHIDKFITFECRCGFLYKNDKELGIKECEYCSCYIFIKSSINKISN